MRLEQTRGLRVERSDVIRSPMARRLARHRYRRSALLIRAPGDGAFAASEAPSPPVFPESPERPRRPPRCSVLSSIVKRLPERSTQ